MTKLNRDEIIKALEYLISYESDQTPVDYIREIRGAIDLLKDDEPRVLTWDELWGEGHPQTVWVEDPGTSDSFIEARYDEHGFYGDNRPIYVSEDRSYWFAKAEIIRESYGRLYVFRAWSKEPTERQRKAVEWDG